MSSIYATRSVFFGTISNALNGTSKREERREHMRDVRLNKIRDHVLSLGHAKQVRKSELCERALSPATTVQVVLLLANVVSALRREHSEKTMPFYDIMTLDNIVESMPLAEGVEPIKTRFDWSQCSDAILGWAKEIGADLSEVGRVFGLVEKSDRIVASEPETVVEPLSVAEVQELIETPSDVSNVEPESLPEFELPAEEKSAPKQTKSTRRRDAKRNKKVAA